MCRFPSLDYLAIGSPRDLVARALRHYAWVPGVLGRCKLRSQQQSPTVSSTLFPSPTSSTTAVSLPWEEDASYARPLSIATSQWDIPSRQSHPDLDAMLTYVSKENIPDYVALRFLSH